MKQLRFASMTVLTAAMAALVFLPGPRASGQSAPGDKANQLYVPLELPGSNNGPYHTIHLERGGQDPEMQKLLAEEGKLEREASGLRGNYARNENDAERAKIKTKLADVLAKQFDVQQQRREVELTRLEKQVKKLRELMKKRTDVKQTIVEKHVEQLIREAEGLGWTAPPGFFPKTNFFGGDSLQAR